jgi:hypothetical protein
MAALTDLSDDELIRLRERAATAPARDVTKLSDDELMAAHSAARGSTDPRGEAGFGDRMVDAFTFGLSKDAAALAKTGPREMASWFTGEPYDFSASYGRAREGERARLDAYSEANPIKGAAADATGILSGAALFKAPAAATITGRVMQAGREGGTAGGLAGFGEAEGGLTDRALGAATGAAIGGTIGAVAAPSIEGIGRLGGRMFGRNAVPAPGVNPAARVSDAGQFGIPLTRGQATGNLSQQASEEAMRHAGRGEGAARVMQQFDDRQTAAIASAADNFQGQFAGNAPRIIAGDSEVGGAVAGGVRTRANALKATGQKFYDEAQSLGARIGADAAEAAPQDIARRLAADNFRFNEGLHPTAFQALAEIERFGSLGARATSPATIAGRAATPKAVDFGEAHDVMKAINQMKPRDGADAAALGMVKRAFAGWWDDAVDANLFAGSERALEAVKQGNRNWSQYLAIVRPKTGDDAGRVVKKMVAADVTGQEVANWLYGASIVRPPGYSTRVASRLKRTFGETSDEWSAVRQGAWLRIVGSSPEKTRGPQAVANDITEFISGRGAPLAATLYTQAERAKMLAFARVLRSTVPSPKATNPSKTSYGMARMLRAVAYPIAATLGFSTSGLGGAAGAMAAVPFVRNVTGSRAAQKAISPKLTQSLFSGAPMTRLGVNATALGAGGAIPRTSIGTQR